MWSKVGLGSTVAAHQSIWSAEVEDFAKSAAARHPFPESAFALRLLMDRDLYKLSTNTYTGNTLTHLSGGEPQKEPKVLALSHIVPDSLTPDSYFGSVPRTHQDHSRDLELTLGTRF